MDGQVITESLAIIEYLEETHPDVPLLPKDPIKRAHARAISLLVSFTYLVGFFLNFILLLFYKNCNNYVLRFTGCFWNSTSSQFEGSSTFE